MLRDDATLRLINIDDMHEPLRKLAESLESRLQCPVMIHLYAGWRENHYGLPLHYDDKDVFIIQISGRKDWKIYGQSAKEPYPVGEYWRNEQPPDKLVWEGTLNQGDVLYMPRGWWHFAAPVGEPTLHLTVSTFNRNGAEFLQWVGRKLVSVELIRKDLPCMGSPDELAKHCENILSEINKAWSKDLIHEYYRELNHQALMRPRFALPPS